MDIKVVSTAGDVIDLCREVVTEVVGDHCRVSAVEVLDPGTQSDLYIWDFHPKLRLPAGLDDNPGKHVLLVSRQDLPEIREMGEASAAVILLKPVKHRELAAFLSCALSGQRDASLRIDRDRMLQHLLEMNVRLQQCDEARTNFLTRAVNDFRAPLTVLNGYVGLLLSEVAGVVNQNQKEVLRRVQNSVQHLARHISAMLQMTAERDFKTGAPLEIYDIGHSSSEALLRVNPVANEKRIRLTMELLPCEGDLYGHPDQIEEVLVGLLDNACKFTPANGAVEIRGYPFFWERRALRPSIRPPAERRKVVTRMPNSYRIDIRDSGVPIPPKSLHRVFDAYTFHTGATDRSGGGLALAVCRMVVAQHKGRVWAENTGTGVMFCLVLPFSKLHPQEAAVAHPSKVEREKLHLVV